MSNKKSRRPNRETILSRKKEKKRAEKELRCELTNKGFKIPPSASLRGLGVKFKDLTPRLL
jgi:hypothetical protein